MTSNNPILPSDRYLAQLLGITDDQYADFKIQARQRAKEHPSTVVAGIDPVTWTIISIVLTVISIGLTIVASFFKPKPGRPASIEGVDKSQDAINSVERYAPRVGFDATQDIARIGQAIPLVFARRESVGNETVGGIRITTPLIWSQIQSFGGNQLLRALFLISEGEIHSIDPNNFAIGSNVIGSYQLTEAGEAARLSIYLNKGGGATRINSSHFLTGRPSSSDPGAESAGDIFTVNGEPDFCSVSKPTTQTTFGLYAPIGNNLGFRVNPVFRPGVNANLVPKGKKGDATVKCTKDTVSLSQRKKYEAFFSTRSGLISGNVGSIGSECTYKLFKSSDKDTDFSIDTDAAAWSIELEVEGDEGNSSEQVLQYLGFFSSEGSVMSASQAKALVTVGPLTTDVEERTVSYTVSFNIFTAQPFFADKEDGVYTLTYDINLKNSSDEDEEIKIDEEWRITAEVVRPESFSWVGNTTVTDAEWQYNFTTDALTKVTVGSGTTSGHITVQTGAATVKFYGDAFTTVNATAGTITRSFVTSYQDAELHEEKAGDVASTVASKQRGWDDALIAGELYKVGSALCICSDRTDDVFQSEAEFEEVTGGKEVEVTFKTIRPGQVATYSPALLERMGNEPTASGDRKTGTNGPHIHRIAIGEISTSRACERVEIGLKSVLGTRISGLCNFKDTLSFTEVDFKACNAKKGSTVKKGDVLKLDQYQSGFISCSSDRYSFFRISYREAGITGPFTTISAVFGVRGITQQNQFNGIAFNMPSRKRWVFRFEPISGWEIRNDIATGPLYVLNSKVDNTISAGVTSFRGQLISRNSEEFWITVGRRTDDLGIPHRDVTNYIDHYGKVAEQFIYEEVSTSTSGPEHEIVYINEIVANANTPTYDNLAILGLNIRASTEWQQFSQFSCYVTGGIDNTHLFPEILKKLLLNDRYGLGHAIKPEQIDDEAFASATAWCASRGYYFDGVISERQNIRQWAADVAATMLLIFGEANGKFFLRPAVPFADVEIKGMFTADNVLEGTYQMQYFDSEDRQPIQVSIKYREERDSDNPTSPGLFPTEREILIKEAGTSETEKIEPIDVSDYVTSRYHAIDIAKFVIRMRRLPTHGIKFQTTYDGLTANLAPGDYIRCAIDTTYYDDFNNGVVLPTGELTSTQTLANGTYQVFAWDGSGDTSPTETTLTVSGGTAAPTGVIFSVQNIATSIRTYQIESLGIEENGAISIEAVHMPTDQMTADWDSAGAWSIEE